MKYLLILIILILSATTSSAQPHINTDKHGQLLESIHAWMEINAGAVFNFWDEKAALRKAEDGFYGDIDSDGNSAIGLRNSIQQGRQLFTVATWYRYGEQSDRIAEMAYNQYRYFIRVFHDREGGEFFLSEGDNPDNRDRRLYNNSFAIYGLSHYYLAFHDHENQKYRDAAIEALSIALNGFIAMDHRAYDTVYGGYQQIPVNGLAENEVPLDGGDKEANTHLHIMEAYTTLFEAWQNGNPLVNALLTDDQTRYLETHLADRLDEILTEVMVNRFCKERGEYAYCRTEFERDWTLANDRYFSFAHDIETAWLFMEALRVLGNEASDPHAVTTMAEKLIHTVYTYGMKPVGDGYASVALGHIADFSVYSDQKDWWQHFEAFAGLYEGARLSDSPDRQEAYLNRLLGVLTYLDESDLKVTFGEDMWEFRRDNTLAGEWKAGYHTLRALLFVKHWIEEDLKSTG